MLKCYSWNMDTMLAFRSFVRLVDLGSFTAVADELGVKQSTVSKWLANLEERFGCRLIHRTTRAQAPTEAGARFYERAIAVLSAFDETVSAMQHEDQQVRGRLRLSLPVVFGRLFVVPIVTAFARKHPEVSISMHFSDHYSGLVGEGIDLAVRVGVPVDSTLLSHTLAETSRLVVASPGYLRRCGTPSTPEALVAHECLQHSVPGTPKVWTFRKGKKSKSVQVRGRVSADNSEVTRALARSGLGICMLATWLVAGDVRSGRLVSLLDSWTTPTAPIRALTPPGRQVPPHVRSFIECLQAELPKALVD